MSFESLIAFTIAMALLAASPGPGLAAVLSRAANSGAQSGYRVVVGLVLVDFLFLAIALSGMSAISTALGPLFEFVKYLAAIYLIYLGIQSIESAGMMPASITTTSNKVSASKDVALGSLVTLGNPKAIVFYSAFLPTFFQVELLGLQDYVVICTIITLVSAVIYGVYISLLSRRLQSIAGKKILKRIQVCSGVTLAGSGVVVAMR